MSGKYGFIDHTPAGISDELSIIPLEDVQLPVFCCLAVDMAICRHDHCAVFRFDSITAQISQFNEFFESKVRIFEGYEIDLLSSSSVQLTPSSLEVLHTNDEVTQIQVEL